MHPIFRLTRFRVNNIDMIEILCSLAAQVPDFVMLQHVTFLAQGDLHSHGSHC